MLVWIEGGSDEIDIDAFITLPLCLQPITAYYIHYYTIYGPIYNYYFYYCRASRPALLPGWTLLPVPYQRDSLL